MTDERYPDRNKVWWIRGGDACHENVTGDYVPILVFQNEEEARAALHRAGLAGEPRTETMTECPVCEYVVGEEIHDFTEDEAPMTPDMESGVAPIPMLAAVDSEAEAAEQRGAGRERARIVAALRARASLYAAADGSCHFVVKGIADAIEKGEM